MLLFVFSRCFSFSRVATFSVPVSGRCSGRFQVPARHRSRKMPLELEPAQPRPVLGSHLQAQLAMRQGAHGVGVVAERSGAVAARNVPNGQGIVRAHVSSRARAALGADANGVHVAGAVALARCVPNAHGGRS